MKAELLAPAGSYDALRAAVAAGADAVYVGGTLFGARAYAKNFDREELLSAIDYVHLHHRKLYLTVNTLLKDDELEHDLYEYLLPFYCQGVDAVIVQDLGAVSVIRRCFPDLPVHASTQMTITGSAGARFAEKLGICRIVPARELSLSEIRKIHRTTHLEIECFVHGALCYCYSGQCLFSSLIGTRSGNRGRCAQPCRLPYEVFDRDGHRLGEPGDGFPLSPKDMCTVELLPQILAAGVTSLKIEGRMKKPEYTAGVVHVYRKYLDLLEKDPSHYRVLPEDWKELYDLYQRDGFNQSYYFVRNGREMMALKNEKVQLPRNRKNRKEQLFYEIRKKYLETEIQEPVTGFLSLYPGQPSCFGLTMGGETVTVEGDQVEFARKQPLSEERVRIQMQKTGASPFYFEDLQIYMAEDCFLSVQALNDLRRKACGALGAQLTEGYHRNRARRCALNRKEDHEKEVAKKEAMLFTVSVETKPQLLAAMAAPEVSLIYVDLFLFGREEFEEHVLQTLVQMKTCKKQLFLSLPYAVREGDLKEFREPFENLCEEGLSGFLVRNLESYAFLKEAGLARKVVLDYSIYTFNRECQNFWEKEGILRDTVPYELTEKEITMRNHQNSELLVYGYQPMMVSAQCIQKNLDGCRKNKALLQLKDRMGKIFPVKCICDSCYNVIYNSVPLSLVGEVSQILSLSLAGVRLSFTIENGKETEAILNTYRKAFFQNIIPTEKGEFTKGHFHRRVE